MKIDIGCKILPLSLFSTTEGNDNLFLLVSVVIFVYPYLELVQSQNKETKLANYVEHHLDLFDSCIEQMSDSRTAFTQASIQTTLVGNGH